MNDAASVTVRAATADDAERLATLLTDEGYPAGASDLAARIARFSTADARVLVAEAGGEVIGFVAFHILPRFETDERFARIVALVVDPGVRARGIGRQLMVDAERIAAADGAAFLEVTAGHHRPDARKLFESLGYDAGLADYLRKRP
jgi:ribosomal protein S18 acetylase RimI-like enzyme